MDITPWYEICYMKNTDLCRAAKYLLSQNIVAKHQHIDYFINRQYTRINLLRQHGMTESELTLS